MSNFLLFDVLSIRIRCTWSGEPCSPKNFTQTVTDYGVCYTFNAGQPPLTTSKTGKIHTTFCHLSEVLTHLINCRMSAISPPATRLVEHLINNVDLVDLACPKFADLAILRIFRILIYQL